MIIHIRGKCSVKDCDEEATCIAAHREGGTPALYCQEHGDALVGDNDPEYDITCPNCGCRFGCN